MVYTIIIAGFLALEGIVGLVTGKMLGSDKSAGKYTKESYTKYCRISGALSVFAAAAVFVMNLDKFIENAPEYLVWVGVGLIVVFCLLEIYIYRTVLKKKGSEGSDSSSENDNYVDMD